MRTDEYVNRLMAETKAKRPNVTKIARMLQLTLNKISSAPAGADALRLVQARMFKNALRQASLSKRKKVSTAPVIPVSAPIPAIPAPIALPQVVSEPTETKRRARPKRHVLAQ